jgi:GNAT superfamily N-acetyltransferase
MFEVIDDVRTARALLDRASAWLRARGRTQIMGPVDYSTNYPCGLLVDGFDTPPAVMMNHQPAYYERLLKRYGLEKTKDIYAWWFGREHNMDAAWSERVTKLAGRYNVKVRPLDMNNFDAEIARCKQIYHQSLEQNWGFVKMSDAEFDHLARDLKRLAEPELVQFAEVDGKPVGVSITLPNINEAIQPLGGRLMNGGLPIGLIRLACRLKKIRTGRLAVLGVVPGYRKRGVAESLIWQTLRAGLDKFDYHGAELSWTLEDNTLVNRMIERVGGKKYKTYRIFSKSLVC